MLLPLLLACSVDPDDSALPATEEEEYVPAPYIVEEESPPESAFSASEVEAALGEAISLAMSLTGQPVFPAYFAVMEGADDACPNYYESEGNVYWYDVCTSEQGTAFNGYSFYYYYDHYYIGDEAYTGDALFGVAQVQDDDGHLFQAGGTAYDLIVEGDGYQYWYSVAQGGFSYDGREANGTWLEDGLAPDMLQYVYYVPSVDARGYVMQGSVSGLTGGFSAAVFDGIQILDEVLGQYFGANCSEEPGGIVSMRDEAGNWYDILFDGPSNASATTPEGMCDGCGEAFFRGESVGQVCVDFTVLNAWTGAPW